MISKTKQLEKFKKLLKDKSFNQRCRLRLDHHTVKYYNNGKRTKAQIAEHTKIPLRLVSIFMEVSLDVWDLIMKKPKYWDWIGREFGESVKESVIRRNRKNRHCGTTTYEPKIEKCIKSY